MKTFASLSFNLRDGLESSFVQSIKSIVPALDYSQYKGMMGRVAVIGGSRDYTGAPFYASVASLKFGGDLSFIFCSSSSAIPIKCYSPEIMVTPFYNEELLLDSKDSAVVDEEVQKAVTIVEEFLPRVHSVVVGPGVGRNENVFKALAEIISLVRNNKKLLVIDADGLSLISQRPSLVRGYSRCILTPNKAEFDRLLEGLLRDLPLYDWEGIEDIRQNLIEELQSEHISVQTRAASIALGGVTILRKGRTDIITNGEAVFEFDLAGAPRRCGGQGDLLSGCLGVAFHWSQMTSDYSGERISSLAKSATSTTHITNVELHDLSQPFPEIEESYSVSMSKAPTKAGGLSSVCDARKSQFGRVRDDAILSSLLAASVIKTASSKAFERKGRAMTAPDVLDVIGDSFETIMQL